MNYKKTAILLSVILTLFFGIEVYASIINNFYSADNQTAMLGNTSPYRVLKRVGGELLPVTAGDDICLSSGTNCLSTAGSGGTGGGSSIWATTTPNLYYNNDGYQLVYGGTATTSDNAFEIIGGLQADSYYGAWAGDAIDNAFIASSTEYLADTDTTYTATNPITLTGTAFGIESASTTLWETDTDTTYLGGTNLSLVGTTFNVDDPFSVTNLTATYASNTQITVSGNSWFGGNANIDGYLAVGVSSHETITVNGTTKEIQFGVHGDDVADKYVAYFDRASDTHSPTLAIMRAGGTHAAQTQADDDMILGQIGFFGWDDTDNDLNFGASIRARVNGTPGQNDLPTELVFSTTADGASTPTEHIYINNAGYLGVATATPAYQLDVYGNSRIDGILTVSYASTTGITATNIWATTFTGNLVGDVTGTASGNLTSSDIDTLAELNALMGETIASTTQTWADAYVEDNITVTGYMEDEDINTMAELNSWVSQTLLISGGTLTSGKICRYDGTGIDCDYTDITGSGTGLSTSTAIADTYIIYGTSASAVGAESAFNYDDATDVLTVVNASTTGLTATNGWFTSLYGTLTGNVTGDLTGNADTATNVSDADMGDITISGGDWAVEDDSHNHVYSDIDAFTEANLYTILSDVSQFYESGDKVGDADTLDTHDTSYFLDGENFTNDTIDNDSIDWGDMTDLGTDGVVTWSNLASGELTSEVLIIGTDVKGGTLTDTKYCTWDDGNSQIVCNSEGGSGWTFATTTLDYWWDNTAGITPSEQITAGTNISWSSNTLNVDDAFLVNDANDTMTGILTCDGLTMGADENITLGSQTIDNDGTDFVFSDSLDVTGDITSSATTTTAILDVTTGTHGMIVTPAASTTISFY